MKIALYCRVSTNDGRQDVARQLEELREFCNQQNWDIVEEITENISGRRKKREGTQRLINLARSNQIQKVLIHEISRLGRNAADVMQTVEALIEAKVSVFDFHQRLETLDSNFQKTTWATMILPLLAGMAEEWVRQHSYRIKSGLKKAQKDGKKLGRPKAEKIKQEDEILSCLKQGMSLRKTEQETGCSRMTVIKVKKKYRKELEEEVQFVKQGSSKI
jgi:DNA invertase Pin-like site-specific DNA recombinase